MAKDFKLEKQAIIAGVALLLLADIGLAVYSWRLSSAPAISARDLDAQSIKLKKLKAEIEDAENTQKNFPQTVNDCDKFEQSLPPAATVSSTISGELADVAKKAGIQLTGMVFRDKEKEKDKDFGSRGISERAIDATISGNYDGVVKFLNGLEKSEGYYVVDSLELSTEATTPNLLRVSVHMRTFFRTAGS
ncbi:MAG: hypothetical protein NVS9B14_23770 [Candidatus Acidiferrum sp.]